MLRLLLPTLNTIFEVEVALIVRAEPCIVVSIADAVDEVLSQRASSILVAYALSPADDSSSMVCAWATVVSTLVTSCTTIS